jgi:hypothetical protein
METSSTISSNDIIQMPSESVNLLDVLRVIGMQEVANNVFTLPKKKK